MRHFNKILRSKYFRNSFPVESFFSSYALQAKNQHSTNCFSGEGHAHCSVCAPEKM